MSQGHSSILCTPSQWEDLILVIGLEPLATAEERQLQEAIE